MTAGKQSELTASELSAMMLERADLDARIGPENHRNHARCDQACVRVQAIQDCALASS